MYQQTRDQHAPLGAASLRGGHAWPGGERERERERDRERGVWLEMPGSPSTCRLQPLSALLLPAVIPQLVRGSPSLWAETFCSRSCGDPFLQGGALLPACCLISACLCASSALSRPPCAPVHVEASPVCLASSQKEELSTSLHRFRRRAPKEDRTQHLTSHPPQLLPLLRTC